MPDSASILDRITRRAQGLYSLPAVAMQVLELTNHPKVDVPALKQCIENDPALTTKVLRVVNSSLFGLSREVSDLNQALALLGTKPLKLLVLGFSLPDGLFADVASDQLERYWRMALTKSVAAREISETFWSQPGDEAFIGGLLQDIGVLVLLRELGEPYVRFLDRIAEDGVEQRAAETEALRFDHTTLSARVLDHWGLPESLTAVIAMPSSPGPQPRLPDSDNHLARILQLADLVTQLVAQRRIGVLPDLLELGAEYCKLTKPRLTELIEHLEAKVDQLADVMSLDLPTGMDYRDVLVQAHAQISEVASDVAEDMVCGARSTTEIYDHLLSESRALAEAAAQFAQQPALAVPAATGPAPRGASVAGAQTAGAERKPSLARAADLPDEVDPKLLERLSSLVMHCRSQRIELSLLVVEIDAFDQLVTARGRVAAEAIAGSLESVCRGLNHPGGVTSHTREPRLKIILPDCDRRQAVEYGNQIVRSMCEMVAPDEPDSQPALTISVGAATVALPPKNFRPQDLVEASQRCLYGAQSSGGSSVKSIEIY